MKRIVIIGASSGLGRRIAGDFARLGFKVGIAARREPQLKAIYDQYPDLVTYRTIDVTAPDAVERFYDLIEANGGMDILLLASGVGHINPQLDIATDVTTVQTNATGTVRILDAAYRYYRDTANEATPGQIAVITSVAGTKGIGIAASYSASKRFQSTYIDALDQLAHQEHVNVRFTDIRPGFIRTPILKEGRKYPLEMAIDYAAPLIEKAILQRKRVAVIDTRWRVVVALWRMIPQCVWRHIAIDEPQDSEPNS